MTCDHTVKSYLYERYVMKKPFFTSPEGQAASAEYGPFLHPSLSDDDLPYNATFLSEQDLSSEGLLAENLRRTGYWIHKLFPGLYVLSTVWEGKGAGWWAG